MAKRRSFRWWVEVFVHNWFAHTLFPFREIAHAFVDWVDSVHDYTALPFTDDPTEEFRK